MSKKWWRQLRNWTVALVLGIAMVAGLVWGAWTAMGKVEVGVARGWALIATTLLPVLFWLGWWFGHTEARGRLAGIDQTVDKFMSAASRIVGVRASTRAARPVVNTTTVLLPMPRTEITARKQLPGQRVVDL